MPIVETARLEPLRDAPRHPPHSIRGLRLRESDDLLGVGVPVGRVIEMLPGLDDHARMPGADAAGTLCLPHPRESLDQERRLGHATLHRPVGHPQRRPQLRGHRARGQVAEILVACFICDLQRQT